MLPMKAGKRTVGRTAGKEYSLGNLSNDTVPYSYLRDLTYTPNTGYEYIHFVTESTDDMEKFSTCD